jgi:hypothetical protein
LIGLAQSLLDDLINAYDRKRDQQELEGNSQEHREPQPPRTPAGPLNQSEALWERSKHKSAAKRRRDRERSRERDLMFEARRKEILQLYGYVKTKNGLFYSIAEAIKLLVKGELKQEDVDVWSVPESFRDVLNSFGEVDAMATYPALGITRGTVLFDPKIRVPGGHKDRALRKL